VRAQPAIAAHQRRVLPISADSGHPAATGFFSELGRIFTNPPAARSAGRHDFRGCIQRIFHRPDDWIWLQAIAVRTVCPLLARR